MKYLYGDLVSLFKDHKFDLQLFATADTQSVHAGHTIFIRVNNQRVGRAQAIDGERSFGTEGIYEIGSIMPQEHINNRYEGSLNIERFFMSVSPPIIVWTQGQSEK
jgi:hypothetical protein